MYYLRKRPYKKEFKDPTTGEVDFVDYTSDRALFKSTNCGRRYRMQYPSGGNGVKLWKCKRLSAAIKERLALWWYCNEWFDIYDDEDDSIVSEEIIKNNYKPPLVDTCYLVKPYYRDLKNQWVYEDEPTQIKYTIYPVGTKLKVYRWLDWYREWDDYPDFDDFQTMKDKLIAVDSKGFGVLAFDDYQQYEDFENTNKSWETSTEREFRLEAEEEKKC